MTAFFHPDTRIAGKKDENLAVRIDFEEMRFKPAKDGCYNLFFWLISTDARNYKKDDKQAEMPGPASFYIDASKGPGQKALAHHLSMLDEKKCYSGFISVNDGVELYGKGVGNPQLWENVKDEIGSFLEVEQTKLKDENLKVPKSTRNSGYGGESAYDAATGRLQAFTEMMTNQDLTEFAALYATDQKVSQSQAMLTILSTIIK